jgi:hypothetical protein
MRKMRDAYKTEAVKHEWKNQIEQVSNDGIIILKLILTYGQCAVVDYI